MDGFFLVRSYSLVVVWCCCHPCKFFPFWIFFFSFNIILVASNIASRYVRAWILCVYIICGARDRGRGTHQAHSERKNRDVSRWTRLGGCDYKALFVRHTHRLSCIYMCCVLCTRFAYVCRCAHATIILLNALYDLMVDISAAHLLVRVQQTFIYMMTLVHRG